MDIEDRYRVWKVVTGELPPEAATLEELHEFESILMDIYAHKYSGGIYNTNEEIH